MPNKKKNKKINSFYVTLFKLFLSAYELTEGVSGQHMVTCSEDNPPGKDDICIFEDHWLGEVCQKKEKWGYPLNTPCVILKLNKMIEWTPDVYKSLDELPEDMPQSLVETISNRTADNNGVVPAVRPISLY